jgi:uncharacterized protein with FMN-binding domain
VIYGAGIVPGQQLITIQDVTAAPIYGATNSCKTVLKAIEIALSKGQI